MNAGKRIVDTNVRDGFRPSGELVAPWIVHVERQKAMTQKTLERKLPPVLIPNHVTKWTDGRAEDQSNGGMYLWYALAALHRCWIPKNGGKEMIEPGRSDLEVLALALHLRHQRELLGLYTADKWMRIVGECLDLPIKAVPGQVGHSIAKVDSGPYRNLDWCRADWFAESAHKVKCDMGGYLRPKNAKHQSFYSQAILRRFLLLSETEHRDVLEKCGFIYLPLTNVLELVRCAGYECDERLRAVANQYILQMPPLGVIAAPLYPFDYMVATSIVAVEAQAQGRKPLGKASEEHVPLSTSDVLILAAAIGRATYYARKNWDVETTLHLDQENVPRIRRFLLGDDVAHVRDIPWAENRDLSAWPEMLRAVRNIRLAVTVNPRR